MTGFELRVAVLCQFADIIAVAGDYEDSRFLINSRNMGIKSGCKKFDIVPECAAIKGNVITLNLLVI